MTTRLHRLWSPGDARRRVFMPNFWVAIVRPNEAGDMMEDGNLRRHNEYLTPNTVKLEVPMEASRHEVREYMTKIYNWPVRQITMAVTPGRIYYSTPDPWARSAQDKEHDRKYAYVTLREDISFEFPELLKTDAARHQLRAQENMRAEQADLTVKQGRAEKDGTRDSDRTGKWFSV